MCNIKYKCRIPQLLGRLVGYSIKKLHTSLAKGKSPFFFPSSLTKIAFFPSKKRMLGLTLGIRELTENMNKAKSHHKRTAFRIQNISSFNGN